ncbi:MAG: hypothetical protein LBT76_01880 [Tannerella sp.]|nr:hypothetical protein [Tannerella sp.]
MLIQDHAEVTLNNVTLDNTYGYGMTVNNSTVEINDLTISDESKIAILLEPGASLTVAGKVSITEHLAVEGTTDSMAVNADGILFPVKNNNGNFGWTAYPIYTPVLIDDADFSIEGGTVMFNLGGINVNTEVWNTLLLSDYGLLDFGKYQVTVDDGPPLTFLKNTTCPVVFPANNTRAPKEYAVTVKALSDKGVVMTGKTVKVTVAGKSFPVVTENELAYDVTLGLQMIFFDGRPHPFIVTPKPGVEGVGKITVLYNGEPEPPVYAGSYVVTIVIEDGDSYNGTTLEAGTFHLVSDLNPSVQRSLDMPAVTGIITYPGRGVHYVPTSRSFKFSIKALPGYSIKDIRVSTNTAHDADLILTRITSDSLVVILNDINENLIFRITGVTETGDFSIGNESVAGASVWAHDGALHVQTPESGTVYVYTPGGQLYGQTPVAAGKKTLPLPKGTYIVVWNRETAYKVFVR